MSDSKNTTLHSQASVTGGVTWEFPLKGHDANPDITAIVSVGAAKHNVDFGGEKIDFFDQGYDADDDYFGAGAFAGYSLSQGVLGGGRLFLGSTDDWGINGGEVALLAGARYDDTNKIDWPNSQDSFSPLIGIELFIETGKGPEQGRGGIIGRVLYDPTKQDLNASLGLSFVFDKGSFRN